MSTDELVLTRVRETLLSYELLIAFVSIYLFDVAVVCSSGISSGLI